MPYGATVLMPQRQWRKCFPRKSCLLQRRHFLPPHFLILSLHIYITSRMKQHNRESIVCWVLPVYASNICLSCDRSSLLGSSTVTHLGVRFGMVVFI